ncbi:MAG: methionyl-tRNA formyltransferase [Sphingomonadaceae bacterium]
MEVLAAADLDWLFIIGWSQIAGAAVLGAPRKGVLGMHPTLLPTGRGRAAIPWAILKDLSETGVTMFKLDEGVDSGPIAAQHRIAMHSRTNATELYDAVERGHAVLMEDVFPRLVDDAILLTDQDHAKATEWPARTPKDGRLELGGTVEHADRLIRAVTRPYPGAFIEIGDRRLTVWAAEIATESTHFPNAPMLSFSNGSLLCSEWEEQAFEK